MNDIPSVMMQLISSEMGWQKLNTDALTLSESDLEALYTLSVKHDIAQIVASALLKNHYLDGCEELAGKFRKQLYRAVYRCTKLDQELAVLCGALEKAEIPFIPLKGSVIRKYYPEPWMRTSCDIDILIHTEDFEKCTPFLTEEMQYQQKGATPHDISFYSPSGVHIELHHTLIEDGRIQNATAVLDQIWENTTPSEGRTYQQNVNHDFFCFYHIAHMAKHFKNGGCGIRPFIDLFLLGQKGIWNLESCKDLLEESGMGAFASAADRLSKVWFAGREADPLTAQMQDYLLSGGVYGTMKNLTEVQTAMTDHKGSYLSRRIFMPYESLKFRYPILKKYRWLTPFYEVKRWISAISAGHLKNSVSELRCVTSVSADKAKNITDFLKQLGLE